jgi:hypothetical protein
MRIRKRPNNHASALTTLPLFLLALLVASCDSEFLLEAREAGQASQVTLNPVEATVSVGDAQQFEVEVRDRFGNLLADAEVTWSSRTPEVVAVAQGGLTEALAKGTATIEAQAGRATGSATVIVRDQDEDPDPSDPKRPGAVTDLRTTGSTSSSIRLAFTEVDDGRGSPAVYRVSYAPSASDPSWPDDYTEISEGACAGPVEGREIDGPFACGVPGLDPGTDYRFGLVAYRDEGEGSEVFGPPSNRVTASTADEGAFSSPGTVTDLRITRSSSRSVRVAFTEVDDGTGRPAFYRVRYAPSASNPSWPDDYTTVTTGACANPAEGVEIDGTFTCEVTGLLSGTDYDVGAIAYRYDDGGSRIFGEPSNVATGRTDERTTSEGIWISREEVMQRPTSGAAWDQLLADAARHPGRAQISDQHSNHDVYTLAAALVCVRTGEYCSKARRGVLDAIGTEDGGRWLAVGRNLGAYVVAADLLDLRADGDPQSAGTRVEEWMQGWLTKLLRNNNTTDMRPFGPFHAGANAAAQEGFAYAAVGAYLQDDEVLKRAWSGFRTFACDSGTRDHENIDLIGALRDGWAHDDVNPCAIGPKGAEKRVPSGRPGAGSVRTLDGALIADMRRGGTYRWEPGYTQYPWVGLEGLVPAAVILERAGYPAFELADRAVLRTHEYLWFLRQETGERRWFDGIRAREVVQLVNVVYGTSFPVNEVVGQGRTMGYTDWTHPEW